MVMEHMLIGLDGEFRSEEFKKYVDANDLNMKLNLIIIALIYSQFFCLKAQLPNKPNLNNTNNRKEGDWVYYFDKNMNPISSKDSVIFYRLVTYMDGKPNGRVKDYDLTGLIWSGELLSENPDVYNGICNTYYDGKCINSYNYKYGKLEGVQRMYHYNGTIKYECFYKNGLPNGYVKNYYSNGSISSEGNMVCLTKDKEFKVGEWLYWNENGFLYLSETYNEVGKLKHKRKYKQ